MWYTNNNSPLLSLVVDQARLVNFMKNELANIFTENVDSITNYNKVKVIHAFVDELSNAESNNLSLLLFIFSDIITSNKWTGMLDSIKAKNILKLVVFDKDHYILLAGCFLNPNYYLNVRSLMKKFWNQFHVLSMSTILNDQVMY